MNVSVARAWLDALARAWQAHDADAMAALFTEDATEQVDPFKTPLRGRENLRKGFAWWMKDQSQVHISIGNVDVIGNRFYAEVDASWTVASVDQIQERGLLVCDMEGNQVRAMREFWKTRTG
jgi:uncharacterized protein (TIGR02246 family)